jgi:hypothetical protein
MKHQKSNISFLDDDVQENRFRYYLATCITIAGGIVIIFSLFLLSPTLIKPLIIPLFVLLLFIAGAIRFLGFFNSPWLGYHH